MTLRASEIGADTFSRYNYEADKNNLSTKPNETEHRHTYPELEPGRALLDLQSQTLFEVMHHVQGHTEAVEGNKTSFEERLDWKYGTPKGQDWGGIIQHFFISFAKRQSPMPNHHGEVPVPIERPDENAITDMAPDRFTDVVLSDEGNRPRPLLLLERPATTYEEVIPGDTYDVIGWYWPAGDTSEDRIRPAENIAHRFPEIAGIDGTESTTLTIDGLGLELDWDSMDDSNLAAFDAHPSKTEPEIIENQYEADIVLDATGGNSDREILIFNDYDANDDVMDVSTYLTWDDGHGAFTADGTVDALDEMFARYTGDYTVSLTHDALAAFGSLTTEVIPEEIVEVSREDILEYGFTESVEIDGYISLPNADIDDLDIGSLDDDAFVAIETDDDGNIQISEADSPADTHVSLVDADTLAADIPKKDKSLIKSLNWNDHRYGWDGDVSAWTLNTSGLGPLVEAYTESDTPLTVERDALDAVGNAGTRTENQPIAIDQDAATFIDSYDFKPFEEVFDYGPLSGDDDNDSFVAGLAVTDANLSLMTLDLTISDTSAGQDGMRVSIGDDLKSVPDTVKRTWEPAITDDDDAYAWHKPESGARVEITPVEGWGTEYALNVTHSADTEPEHVVTLADERMAAQQAIVHMGAL